jgi:hypothetical protein
MKPLRLACLPLSLCFALAGCEEPPPRPAAAPTPAAPIPAPAAAGAAVPAGHLSRAEVERVLREGPPWILRRVPVEEVIHDPDGKFVGWRLMGLPAAWASLDLRPGDVVTRVNGHPLETTDEAFDAWLLVAKSKELRVSYERAGATHEMVLPIDGDPTPETLHALESGSPPPRSQPVRQGTVVNIAPDETLDREENGE